MTQPTPPLVLLADDESLALSLMQDALEEAGYQVIAAPDGRAAIEQIDHQGVGLSALVTDIRMGAGPDGWHVARHAREVNPAVAVVYVSGDSAGDWHALGVPHSTMLQKPYTSSQIVVALAAQRNRTDV